MLLQFELCGQDTSTASYTFKLQQSLNFSTLKLKDVRSLTTVATGQSASSTTSKPQLSNAHMKYLNGSCYYCIVFSRILTRAEDSSG